MYKSVKSNGSPFPVAIAIEEHKLRINKSAIVIMRVMSKTKTVCIFIYFRCEGNKNVCMN